MNPERAAAALRQYMAEPGDMQKTMLYLKRLPPGRRNQILQSRQTGQWDIAPATGNVLLYTPNAPNDLQLPEHCIYLLQQYVTGSSESGLWPRGPDGGFQNEDTVPNWCSPVMSAAWIQPEGKGNESTNLLAQFLHQCPQQLSRHDPLVFLFAYTSVLFFARTRPDIAGFVLRTFHAAARNLRLDNSSHPLATLFELLHRMGPEMIIFQASRILQAYVNIIQNTLGDTYPIVQDMTSDIMWRLLQYKLTSYEAVIDLGKTTIAAAEHQGHHRCKYFLQLKVQLVNSYIKLGRFQEARGLAEGVEHSEFRDDSMLPSFHMYMRRINEGEGRWADAKESSLKALTISIKLFGETSDWTLNTLIDYRKHLEAVGDRDTAQKVAQDRDWVIRELCQETELLGSSENM